MYQAEFTSFINDVFFWITWFFELVGAGIIILGAVVCLFKYVQSVASNKKLPVKVMLANQLALGLEFMLAAEILKTVITTHRTLDEIVILAAIVLLRSALSVLIHWELKNEMKLEEANKVEEVVEETK